jgi:hypothetical protein
MHIADSAMEEGIDWSRKLPGTSLSFISECSLWLNSFKPSWLSDSDVVDPTTAADKCVSAFVSLRGRDVFSADAAGFTDPRMSSFICTFSLINY